MACNLGSYLSKSRPTIPVSTESAQSLEETARAALDNAAQKGVVDLVVDESQVTSLLAFELQKSNQQFISDPQVYLRDGQMQVNAKVKSENIAADAMIIIEPQVDATGRVTFEIVSAKVGPIPLPGDIVSQIETGVNQVFNQQLGAMAPNVFIDSLVIADGLMTIKGHTR
jgi:uncharacterized protein YpmS